MVRQEPEPPRSMTQGHAGHSRSRLLPCLGPSNHRRGVLPGALCRPVSPRLSGSLHLGARARGSWAGRAKGTGADGTVSPAAQNPQPTPASSGAPIPPARPPRAEARVGGATSLQAVASTSNPCSLRSAVCARVTSLFVRPETSKPSGDLGGLDMKNVRDEMEGRSRWLLWALIRQGVGAKQDGTGRQVTQPPVLGRGLQGEDPGVEGLCLAAGSLWPPPQVTRGQNLPPASPGGWARLS